MPKLKPKAVQPPSNSLPQTGFLRLNQIVNVPGSSTPPLVPVSKASWYAGIKAGKYPQPVKLGPRTSGYRAEDIRALIEKLGGEQ
jgi:prophage regulatory protein